jgi:hypothetical protein
MLEKMVKSHEGWDRHMAPPRGGGRHAQDIDQLWMQLAECQCIYDAKCKDSKPPPPLIFFSPYPLPAPRGGCFIAGTLVRTSEGLKPIEEVKIDDLVLARDQITGENVYRRVVGTMVAVRNDLVKIYNSFDNELPIVASSNHKFFVERRGWTEASRIASGDFLLDINLAKIEVRKVENKIYPEEIRVYNIEVESARNYYVGQRGVLVHNRLEKVPY